MTLYNFQSRTSNQRHSDKVSVPGEDKRRDAKIFLKQCVRGFFSAHIKRLRTENRCLKKCHPMLCEKMIKILCVKCTIRDK